MKILLFDCLDPTQELETRYPSLGLAYLSAFLKAKIGAKNIQVKIAIDQLEKEIAEFQPQIVGLRSVSQNFNRAKKAARLVKKHGLPTIIGGVHITAVPKCLTQNMDIAVLGEGEETFYKLIKTYLSHGKFRSSQLSKIPGIAFWDAKKIRVNRPAPLISNLDQLPFPDREILPIRPHTYMFTSRGCPFRCTFCASTRFWQKFRFFSAKYVAAEIEEVFKKYSVRFISFYDDLFMADLNRVEELVVLLSRRRLLGKLKLSCNCRANLVTEQSAKLMAHLGIKSVGLGLESGNEEILHFLKVSGASVAQNAKAISILHRHGILANASFIIGSPQETKTQILETLEFIRQNDLDFVDTYLLTPFPGTPIWDYALNRGLVSPKMNWDPLNANFGQQPEKAIILSEKLTRSQLWQLYQLFQRERLKIALKKFWKQPYLMDLPDYFYHFLSGKVKQWLGQF